MDELFYKQQYSALLQLQNDSHQALRIAMCGKFKSGKSSLLNLMLGTKLPVKAVTATGIITKVVYGKGFYVTLKTGKTKKVTEKEFNRYITVVEKNLNGVVLNDVQCALVGTNSGLLQHGRIEFWDTPGLEDDPDLTKITLDAIEQCDLIVYVMHATQVLSQYEKRMFQKLYKKMKGNIIFVVNHMDSLRKDEMNSVVLSTQRALQQYTNPFFSKGSLYFTSANPARPEIEMFMSAIREATASRVNCVRMIEVAKEGKAMFLVDQWKEYIQEDLEESVRNVQKYELLVENDLKPRKEQFKRSYDRGISEISRIQRKTESILLSENTWRIILLNFQKLPGWQNYFSRGSAELIKFRLKQLIQTMNEEIREIMQSIFPKFAYLPLELDEQFLWESTRWYNNFSKPLFFAEAALRQYQMDSINYTIAGIMSTSIRKTKDLVSVYFEQLRQTIGWQYEISNQKIEGEQKYQQRLFMAREEEKAIRDYEYKITGILDNIKRQIIDFSDVPIRNKNDNEKVIVEHMEFTCNSKVGTTFYAKDIDYLYSRVYIKPFHGEKNIHVTSQIYVNGNAWSKLFDDEVKVNERTKYFDTKGWGNKTFDAYSPNIYEWVLTVDGKEIYKQKFWVANGKTDTSIPLVNDVKLFASNRDRILDADKEKYQNEFCANSLDAVYFKFLMEPVQRPMKIKRYLKIMCLQNNSILLEGDIVYDLEKDTISYSSCVYIISGKWDKGVYKYWTYLESGKIFEGLFTVY